MEVPGVCEICGAHGHLHTCAICGRLVCDRHFDEPTRLCVTHARRQPGSSTEPGSEPPNLPPNPEDAGGRYT